MAFALFIPLIPAICFLIINIVWLVPDRNNLIAPADYLKIDQGNVLVWSYGGWIAQVEKNMGYYVGEGNKQTPEKNKYCQTQ